MTNAFRAESLTRRVINETFVRSVEVHEQIVSTNDRGLALANNPQRERPCLILAERQTAGRGRGANRWWSSEGALTCSLLLTPDLDRLPLARWPELSLTVGTAVCEVVRRQLPSADVRLKWPNDVYLDGRKVCGILVEVPGSSTGGVVVGIGLNVNNSVQHAPDALQSKAVALCDVLGEPCSPLEVLISVLQTFERQFNMLSDAPDEIRRLWREFDLLLGCSVTVGDAQGVITGTCEGIDDDGALLLRTEAGPTRVYGGVVQSFE